MSYITTYDFTEEQNAHYLRQILQLITANSITPTPINYAICYEYITGSNKRLIHAFDLLLKKKTPLDNETATKLYKNYIFDVSFESFDEINKNLQTLLNQTQNTLAETSKKASVAGTHFEEQVDNISAAKNTDDIKHVIANVMHETKDLVVASNTLKTELDSAHLEMEKLRKELTTVREAAATDALTGLLNRGSFDNTLNKLIKQDNTPEACLAMLDLDHFKKINDTFGHLIGDNVLKFTAKLLKEHSLPHHYPARYGGEELAIIMPDTSFEKAAEISEKIRSTLEKSRLKKKNNSESIGKVTVSIGISQLKENDTIDSFISRTDNALYQAKESGRNKVILAT